MKLLFIYDNADLKTVTETFGRLVEAVPAADHKHILTINKEDKRKLYDVAVEIKKEISADSNYIIFIDQYLACADEDFEWLQRNAGIALIKFLRMLEVMGHIVLITPYAGKEIELVKQNPANLIITSKGISFAKNLYEFKNKPITELEELAENRFDKTKDLKPYILAEFRLPEDERHNWANWWGIDRLWNIHRVVEKEKYHNTEREDLREYPESLKEKVKELKNRQALFLYGHRETIIANRLAEYNEAKQQTSETLNLYTTARNSFIKERDVIQSLINAKTYEIKKLENRISYIEFRLPGLNGLSTHFSEIRAESIKRISELSNQIRAFESDNNKNELNQHIRGLGNRISTAENDLNELKKQFEQEGEKYVAEIQIRIDALETEIQKAQSRILSLSISAIRKQVQGRSPKILYIDDQGADGWSNIFQHIIYNKEDESLFDVIQPKTDDKINAQYFTDVVSKKIESHNPDLILLDLRLNKESGVRIEVENLSGAVLLKEIRKQYPGIPILMTTASNKSWSYEELQRIGCDAFWTKEGVDTGMKESDSIRNYLRFAELVNILTGGMYSYLKEYYEELNRLEEKGKTQKHWWQNKNRFNKDELQEIEPDIVYNILRDTAIIFKEYLKNKVIKQTTHGAWNEWFYASLVIQNLGKTVEKLHYGGAIVSEKIMEYRGDYCGQQLFQKRNYASHIEKVELLKEMDAIDYMRAILKYLDNRDYCPKPVPKILGKIDLK